MNNLNDISKIAQNLTIPRTLPDVSLTKIHKVENPIYFTSCELFDKIKNTIKELEDALDENEDIILYMMDTRFTLGQLNVETYPC